MTSLDTGFDDLFEVNNFEKSNEKNEVPKSEQKRKFADVVQIDDKPHNDKTFHTPNNPDNIIGRDTDKHLLCGKFCLFFKAKKHKKIILLLSAFVVISIFGGIISTRNPNCGKVSIDL